jgi:glycosidase
MYQDPTRNTVFLDNHDMTRFYSVVNEDFTKFKSGMAMLLTMRGVPQMYYGDEILMAGVDNPDGLVRADFPGGWAGDKVNKFTAEGRTAKENEAFNYVRTLANYRKNTSALQTGKLMQYIPRKGVYTYFRYDSQKTVMITYNGTDKETVADTGYFSERMAGFNSGINVISGEKINNLKQLTLPAKSTLIIELTK